MPRSSFQASLLYSVIPVLSRSIKRRNSPRIDTDSTDSETTFGVDHANEKRKEIRAIRVNPWLKKSFRAEGEESRRLEQSRFLVAALLGMTPVSFSLPHHHRVHEPEAQRRQHAGADADGETPHQQSAPLVVPAHAEERQER